MDALTFTYVLAADSGLKKEDMILGRRFNDREELEWALRSGYDPIKS